jgi:3-oxoadipate enol-lactonase
VGYIGCCHAVAALDLTDRIASIAAPTLVLVGEEDPGTPVEAAQIIHDRIRGSELAVIPSASHLSNMEQPEEFNRLVTQFLGRHDS